MNEARNKERKASLCPTATDILVSQQLPRAAQRMSRAGKINAESTDLFQWM